MPRRVPPFDPDIAQQRLRQSTLGNVSEPEAESLEQLTSIEQRVQAILNIINNPKRNAGNMLFFVMYDIENNKVRRLVVKYLQRKGCTRIQKSIFLADLPNSDFNTIKNDLTEMQQTYDNHDSILIVPISSDYLSSMKVIGQSISIDLITRSKNTLFF